MQRQLLLFFGLLLVGACHHKVAPQQPLDPSVYMKPNTSGSPMLAVGQFVGTAAERKMIDDAVQLANRVMASACFKQHVMTANFTEPLGLDNAGVWNKLVSDTIVLEVIMYRGGFFANHWSKTIGYEADQLPGISYMNRHFVKTPFVAADNLIHEGEGHSHGFRHDGVKLTSVPYSLNEIFEECAAQ